MVKPVKRKCVDCGERVKNRSRRTLRCGNCRRRVLRENAKGRQTGSCSACGVRLSTKKNATGKCKKCQPPSPQLLAWQRIPNTPPWNKGKSAFSTHQEYRKHYNEKRRELRASNPVDIADRIRTLIRNSLKRVSAKKHTKTAVLLGCDTASFREHLEAQFIDGMNWVNYGNGAGRWNIDHIKPLARFNLSDPAQQLEAFHYTNCRPFWAIENIKRHNREKVVAAPLFASI